MFDTNSLNHSNSILQDQLQFLQETKPYIFKITLAADESNTIPKCDYLHGVDGFAHCIDGTTKTIQLKHRKCAVGDFVLTGKKLCGTAVEKSNLGFNFENSRYTIMPQADIYVETIGGKHYCITREEINTIEACLGFDNDTKNYISGIEPKYVITDNGGKIKTGDFYIYFRLETLGKMLESIFRHQNPYLYN